VIYLCLLGGLIAIPAILMYEFANNYSSLSAPLIRAVIELSKIVFADIAVISEVTPAVAAITIAATAPRPFPILLAVLSLLTSAIGYAAYAWLSVHVEGGSVILERSMMAWIQTAIDGHVPRSEYEKVFERLESICASVRVFYVVVFATVAGVLLNNAKVKPV